MHFPETANLFGLTVNLYDLFTVLGFVGALSLALIFSPKYGMPRWKGIVYTVFAFLLGRCWMLFLYWVENGFSGWGGNNIVRIFVWIPLVSVLLCKLLELKWERACDFTAPVLCSIQGISHWGCIFAGCCHGYPSGWGIYSKEVGQVTFPCPPLEAIVAMSITIFLLYRAKQRSYRITGLDYPLMLMLFGYSRFVLEFLRDNNKVLFGCVSDLALHALFAGVVGTVWMYLALQRKQQQKKAKKHGKKRKAKA